MKTIKFFLKICLLLITSQTVMSNESEFVLKPHSSVDGETIGAMTGRWWQWINSMPGYQSPARDMTGEHCDVNQSGNIWFLAGSYSQNKITRKCSVTADKYIAFPIINWLSYPGKNKQADCETIKNNVKKIVDQIGHVFFVIDGEPVENLKSHREPANECFALYPDSGFNEFIGRTTPAASDGYWIVLKPLPTGKHSLHFGGNPSGFSQNIEYILTVVK